MGTMSLLPGVCYSTHNNVNQRYLNPGGKRHKITFFWNTFFWVTSVTKIDIQLKTFMFYNFHAFSGYFFSDTKCYAKVSLRKCATHAHKLLMAKVGKSLLWHNRDLRKSGVKISYDLSSRFVPFQSAFLDMYLKRSLATALWPDAFELQLGFSDKSQCTTNARKSRIFD